MTNNIKWAIGAACVPIISYLANKITGDFALGLTIWAAAILFVVVLGVKGMWDADDYRMKKLYGDEDE